MGWQCLAKGTPGESWQVSASPLTPTIEPTDGERKPKPGGLHPQLSLICSECMRAVTLRRPLSKAQGPWCFHDRDLNPSKCFLPSSLGKCSPEFRLVFQFYDSTGNCFLWKCLQLERPSNMLRESQTHLTAIPSSNPAAPWLLTGKTHSVLQGRSLLPSPESGCTREEKSRGHFGACLACNFG